MELQLYGRTLNAWGSESPFKNKTTLKTLIIGNHITEISNYSFYGCCKLEEIISHPAIPPKIYANTFGGCGKSIPNCTVYVPEGSLHLYKAAEGWKDFDNIIEGLPAGISDVSNNPMQIYPNPAQNEIFIKSDLQIEKIEIYSITGALLISEKFKGKISVSTLTQGIYLLKVYTDKGVMIRKFLKE